MKKSAVISGIAAVILTAYSIYAWYQTRGLRIYVLSVFWGRLLGRSWEYTGLAAVICWLLLAIIVFKIRRGAGKEELT